MNQDKKTLYNTNKVHFKTLISQCKSPRLQFRTVNSNLEVNQFTPHLILRPLFGGDEINTLIYRYIRKTKKRFLSDPFVQRNALLLQKEVMDLPFGRTEEKSPFIKYRKLKYAI